jgi:hypothetical protein
MFSDASIILQFDTIQGVRGKKVNNLGDHRIGHTNQKIVYASVLFRTVSEIELFHCTVPKLLIRMRYYVLLLRHRGADKFLAFPISYFLIFSTTKRIFLGWVKEVRTTKS